jgi:hypothetical protein
MNFSSWIGAGGPSFDIGIGQAIRGAGLHRRDAPLWRTLPGSFLQTCQTKDS